MDLSKEEIQVLISCIRMAASEGFYGFDRDDIGNGCEIAENLLNKFGVDPKEIKWIMEGW